MSERKGFITPEGEKTIDSWIFEDGLADSVDGIAIQLIDNQLLERTKEKIIEKMPESMPIVYEVVDAIIESIDNFIKSKKE